MKKIVLTLAAIAALSTAAFANPNRSWTPLDEQYKATNMFGGKVISGDTAALEIAGGSTMGLSNFERLQKQMKMQDISHN